MKMLRNMVIVALMGSGIAAIAMDTESQAWRAKPLKEKLQIVEQEKEAALNRFRSSVGKSTTPEESAKVAADAALATELDKLENLLLIEQSKEKIDVLKANLERVRQLAREKKRAWYSLSSSSSSSSRDASQAYGNPEGESLNLSPSLSAPSKATKEQIGQSERKLELELDKERERLKKLQNPENDYYQ